MDLTQIYSEMKIIKESSLDPLSLPKVKLQGKCQEAETPNNNGRRYKLKTLQEKIINARCTPDMLSSQPLFGEAIHPEDKLNGEINPEKIVWKINWVKLVDNIMYCEVELIPKGICGEMMYYLVTECGAIPGISSRAFGTMDSDYVDHDSYSFITFDATFNPSTNDAFLQRVAESKKVKEFVETLDSNKVALLNEAFKLDFKGPLVETFYSKNKQQENMESNVEKLTESLSNVSTQLGEAKSQVTSLTESNSAKDAEIKNLKEAKTKLQANYDKSLAVAEGLHKKLVESKKALKRQESLYSKSLAVAEGLRKELNTKSAHYGKSLRVLESVQQTNVATSIEKYVDSNLGKGYYSKNKNLFVKCESVADATPTVKALKEAAGHKPTSPSLRLRPEGKQPKPLDETTQRRVDLYSL